MRELGLTPPSGADRSRDRRGAHRAAPAPGARLPRAPLKVDKNGTADRRGKRFEQVNGEGIVELDALEALHPGVLAGLVRHAVQPYWDEQIEADLAKAARAAQAEADEQWRSAAEDIAGQMGEIDGEIAGILQRHRPAPMGLNGSCAPAASVWTVSPARSRAGSP